MRRSNIMLSVSAFAFLLLGNLGMATAQCTLPYQLTNGQTADATQVMANFNALVSCLGAPAGSTNAVQYNAGAGAFGGVGPLTNGQLVIGSTGAAPQAQTLTPGAGITITNGGSSITIAASGSGSGGINMYYPPGGLTTPTASSFTLNTSVAGSALTDMPSGRGTVLIQPASASSSAQSAQEAAVPSQTAFTATAFIYNTGLLNNNWMVGIAIKDSTGKYDAYGVRNGPDFSRFNIASLGTCCDSFGNLAATQNQLFVWLRVQLTGGNFVFSASYDGENWISVGSAPANSYLGSTLSTVGLFIDSNSGPTFMLDRLSWTLTTP
jgi:hypothetical protein